SSRLKRSRGSDDANRRHQRTAGPGAASTQRGIVMAQLPNPYRCDGCGVLKGETNHWWYAASTLNAAGVAEWWIRQWNSDAESPAVIHLCGTECAIKKLSEFMGGKK